MVTAVGDLPSLTYFLNPTQGCAGHVSSDMECCKDSTASLPYSYTLYNAMCDGSYYRKIEAGEGQFGSAGADVTLTPDLINASPAGRDRCRLRATRHGNEYSYAGFMGIRS